MDRLFSKRVVVVLVMVVAGGVLWAGDLPKIRVAGSGFEDGEGKAFVPFGVNYYRPGTGWAPQVWKQFDAGATRKDFALLKAMGGNCVRVFLTAGSFYRRPGVLEEDGLKKLDAFLSLAEEAGLYVHPTGPDHWEGSPEWTRGDRFSDEKALVALEQFWRLLAARYKGRRVIFAYDLLNEPMVRWDTPTMRSRWTAWAKNRLGEEDASAPAAENKADDRRLLEYQMFREELADEWTRRQAEAIRQADPEALVTVGLIQWAVPAVMSKPNMYAGFRPSRQARYLDFLEVHFYPLERGVMEYGDAEQEARNLAYLEAVVREVAKPGKPVVVAEYGWHGGGTFPMGDQQSKPGREEDQARWCSRLIGTTATLAAGWLNWGFYDHPEARDVSRHTGLLTPEGKEKAWGTAFRELAMRYTRQPPDRRGVGVRPDLPWDRCITDSKAGDRFREEYYRAFLAEKSRVE